MNVIYGNSSPSGPVSKAVPRFEEKHFKPTCSTVPLLSLLKHAPEKLRRLLDELGTPVARCAYLEYPVQPPRSIGPASQTDLMIVSGDVAVAMEAKWTEGLDEPVRAWAAKGTGKNSAANRRERLEAWLDLLRERVGGDLPASDFADVPNQMLHRAASAAATGERPMLVYLLFTPSCGRNTASGDEVRTALFTLWEKLGRPDGFPFYTAEIELAAEAVYEPLLSLKKGPETAENVMDALLSDVPPFRFGPPQVTRMGDAPSGRG